MHRRQFFSIVSIFIMLLMFCYPVAFAVKEDRKGNGMFSRLAFVMDDGQEVEFSSSELLDIAQQVVAEVRNSLDEGEVELPSHEDIDKSLDKEFWDFTRSLASFLEKSYRLPAGAIFRFIKYAYDVCKSHPFLISTIVTNPENEKLLNHISTQVKEPGFEIRLSEHIIIPLPLIQLNTIKHWLFIAKYLAENSSRDELYGWWFKIGGRVIRLNINNEIARDGVRTWNKQFYSGDHGFEKAIRERMQQQIQNCIESFSWGPSGTYFGAFKFFQEFYLQSNLKRFKRNFIELATDDKGEDKNLFLRLAKGEITFSRPEPVSIEHLSKEAVVERTEVFNQTWWSYVIDSKGGCINTSDLEALKIRFIANLDGVRADQTRRRELLIRCIYEQFRPGIIPMENLPEKKVSEREGRFNSLCESYIREHQSIVRREFISLLNEEIAASPERCQWLLFTLGLSPQSRASIKEGEWTPKTGWEIGDRGLLTSSEITVSDESEKKYGAIFDNLIEQFRYVTQAIIEQSVDFNNQSLGPFHAKIRQIMHEKVAENYIMIHVLCELAKAINHGRQEPLFRELDAYGDREAGDSYQKFEQSIAEYLDRGLLNESGLAKKMRSILEGELIEDESLSFLPCLVSAWFISEAARNSLTTMTSLMLLDMVESGVFLDTGYDDYRRNWYSWRNVLIHPLEGADTRGKRVSDVYGNRVDRPSEFGGCHPMANTGSYFQGKEGSEKLNVVHQKEGHLIIHWLKLTIDKICQETRSKYRIQQVKALLPAENKDQGKTDSLESLKAQKAQKERQLDKERKRISILRKQSQDPKKHENKCGKLEDEIKELAGVIQRLEAQEKIKKFVRENVIKRLLRIRMATIKNLLEPYVGAVASGASDGLEYQGHRQPRGVLETDQLFSEEHQLLQANRISIEAVTQARLSNDSTNNVHAVIPRWIAGDGDCAFHALKLTRDEFLEEVNRIYNNPAHELYNQLHDLFSTEVFIIEYGCYSEWYKLIRKGLWAGEFEINLIGLIRNTRICIFRLGSNIFEQQLAPIGAINASNEAWIAHVNMRPVVAATARERNHYIELQRQNDVFQILQEWEFLRSYYEGHIEAYRYNDPLVRRAYDARFGLLPFSGGYFPNFV